MKNLKLFVSLLLSVLLSAPPVLAKESDQTTLSPLPAVLRVDSFLRGERVYAMEDPHFTVDQKTMKDLEFNTAFLPHLVEIAHSELGRNRLRWILTHPLSRREDIIERQNLIRLLASQPELLRQLNNLFAEMAKVTDAREFKDMIYTLRETNYGSFASLQGLLMTFITSVSAISAVAAVFGSWEVLAGTAQMALMNGSGLPSMRKNLGITSLQKIESTSRAVQKTISQLPLQDQRTLSAALQACEDQKSCLAKVHSLNGWLGSDVVTSHAMNLSSLANPLLMMVRPRIKKALPEIVSWFGAMGELEAYVALANFYVSNKNDLVFPEILESEQPVIKINEGHLPYLVFSDKFGSIGNDVDQQQDGHKTIILTGPNAGGKTTYLRMIATNLILAQTGAPIPAQSAAITPMMVATNFANEKDSSTEGLSTFQAQSKRIAQLLASVESLRNQGQFSFVAMDEVLVGTSELEHTALEMSVLEEIYTEEGLLSVLATHYRTLTNLEDQARGVKNLSVDVRGYAIKDGRSMDYNALEVAADQGVPQRVIDRARVHLESLRTTGECARFLDSE